MQFFKFILLIFCLFVQRVTAQIVSIDKFDTANYVSKAKWNYLL